MRGTFISFEGVDGTGKTTQLRLLADWLRVRGLTLTTTREPGGTPLGERLRALLLETGPGPVPPAAELALINAARIAHISAVIRPALERGTWVLCDRFVDATLAYQGAGRGLAPELIRSLHECLCGGLYPDCTLILDLDEKAALARAEARLAAAGSRERRFEVEGPDFLRRVRSGYQALAAAEPERCRLVDAAATPEVVADRIRAHLRPWLPDAVV